MGHYKATMIDSNVPVVTSYNLLGLQKKNFIFLYPLNFLIHLPQHKLAGQYLKPSLKKNPIYSPGISWQQILSLFLTL